MEKKWVNARWICRSVVPQCFTVECEGKINPEAAREASEAMEDEIRDEVTQ